uniref:Chaperone n=1 Tax=viral metagenome TaxID=1070528 RepID=A0A6M3Y1Q0_9ZZZZ
MHNIAYAKPRKFKATVRERYQSIYDRLEDYQILDYALTAYKQRMLECHPDHGGDVETAKMYGESWNWIKKHMKRRARRAIFR